MDIAILYKHYESPVYRLDGAEVAWGRQLLLQVLQPFCHQLAKLPEDHAEIRPWLLENVVDDTDDVEKKLIIVPYPDVIMLRVWFVPPEGGQHGETEDIAFEIHDVGPWDVTATVRPGMWRGQPLLREAVLAFLGEVGSS